MINLNEYDRKVIIRDSDYIFDKTDKLESLLPYLKKKISGEWVISLIEPPISYVRELYEVDKIPEYVKLNLYVSKEVANQILSEYPKLEIKKQTNYDRYLSLISEMKILIKPDVAKELYHRANRDIDKITDYLLLLSRDGDITLSKVRKYVIDERTVYASDVLRAFLTKDISRWTKYKKLVEILGESYAFYAIRRQTKKFLKDKDKYLRNDKTELWYIANIPAPQICYAYTLFHRCTSDELYMCLLLLDNFDLRRAIDVIQ